MSVKPAADDEHLVNDALMLTEEDTASFYALGGSGIDRWPPDFAIERPRCALSPERSTNRTCPLKAEAVEPRLLHLRPLAHHRPNLLRPSDSE